jgi:Tfp pilus assembly protein PilV
MAARCAAPLAERRGFALGFTLIEALLALVICATGVLGIASLLLHGLALHSTSMGHESATALLADMHETLIANPPDGAALAEWQTRVATELPSFELRSAHKPDDLQGRSPSGAKRPARRAASHYDGSSCADAAARSGTTSGR